MLRRTDKAHDVVNPFSQIVRRLNRPSQRCRFQPLINVAVAKHVPADTARPCSGGDLQSLKTSCFAQLFIAVRNPLLDHRLLTPRPKPPGDLCDAPRCSLRTAHPPNQDTW